MYVIICIELFILNNEARTKYSDKEPLGECVYVFRNKDAIWPEIKKHFDWFLADSGNNESPTIYDNERNEALRMIALRNERNELIGYFVVLVEL